MGYHSVTCSTEVMVSFDSDSMWVIVKVTVGMHPIHSICVVLKDLQDNHANLLLPVYLLIIEGSSVMGSSALCHFPGTLLGYQIGH